MKDEFGDRMKEYEGKETLRRFLPMVPVCARLDGKSFHNFTKGLTRPYCFGLIVLMQETTRYLVMKTNANVGYTQSDEISLIWCQENYKSEIFFDGKVQKMTSVLASMATAFFNENKSKYIPSKKDVTALFDCRVWQVPTKEEAVNVLIWREKDAVRNSIQMLAQHYFSHKELMYKSTKNMHDMLHEKGINWNDVDPCAKMGTYVFRQKELKKMSKEDLESLPEKHNARKNPNLMYTRTTYQNYSEPLTKVIDKVGFVFEGKPPVTWKVLPLGNKQERWLD